MKSQTRLLTLGMIAALAACGGSGGGSGGGGSSTLDIQSGAPAPTYNPNSGVLSRNGAAIADSADPVVASRNNASVTDDGGTIFQARAEGANVFAVGYTDTNGDAGTIVGRRAVPNLPNGGSATFNGGYAGISMRDNTPNDPTFSAAVTGLSTVTVDLDNMRVSGEITDRRAVRQTGAQFTPVITAEDVTLNRATLSSDGLFNGSTSGGEFAFAGSTFTPSAGSYEGLLGGASGEEVAGSFNLTHTRDDGFVYLERGVFVAD